MADTVYSSRANRRYLRRRGIKAVIPIKKDQAANRAKLGSKGERPPAFGRGGHKERTTVERCVDKLRRHDPIRQERLIYLGTIDVASIRIWLRHPA